MEKVKPHKHRVRYSLLLVSNSLSGKVHQIRMGSFWFRFFVALMLIVVCAGAGVLSYHTVIVSGYESSLISYEQQIKKLEEENAKIALEKQDLADQILILSAAMNEKTAQEKQTEKELEEAKIPSEFPLTGSAGMKEQAEENAQTKEPIIVLVAAQGTTVVAAGDGSVTAIEDDAEYGHKLTIDHGNGYTSVYRNKGDATVKVGDVITRGTTLFLISEGNTELGFQITYNGAYVDPLEIVEISG